MDPEGSTALASAVARNRLLAALPAGDLRRVVSSLELVHCPAGMIMLEDGQEASRVYFPATAIAARLCLLDDGAVVAHGIVGCDGVVGVPAFLGGGSTPWRVEAVVAGDALRMPVASLLAQFRRGGAFQRLLLAYTQNLIAQISLETVCRSHHSVERRLARLLLQLADRRVGADIPLTQESLGTLLGVRRETVSHAAAHLQEHGCIGHERGHVIVLDAARLAKSACACYRTIAGLPAQRS